MTHKTTWDQNQTIGPNKLPLSKYQILLTRRVNNKHVTKELNLKDIKPPPILTATKLEMGCCLEILNEAYISTL